MCIRDRYHAGKMAAAYVKGIQSKGISACPKHFAANSQELRRMASDSVVDERTFREIYTTGLDVYKRQIKNSFQIVKNSVKQWKNAKKPE